MPDTDSSLHPHIYRAISKRGWYDVIGQAVTTAAFEYRSGEQEISVVKTVNCTTERCDGRLNTCFGEFILETDRVRELGLRVEDDDPDMQAYWENHASILGIPVNPDTEEEAQRAEDLRTFLARIARLHYDRRGRFEQPTT